MAKLTKCPDCGQELSKQAKVCPHCGKPQKKKTSGCAWVLLVGIIMFLFAAISQMNNPSSPPATRRPAPSVPRPAQPTSSPIVKPSPTAAPSLPLSPTPTPAHSEAERQRIYKEIVASELRAIHEADKLYPDFGPKHQAYTDKYIPEYLQVILDKYHVSDAESRSISLEAYEKGWDKPTQP